MVDIYFKLCYFRLQELTTSAVHSNANATTQAAIQAAQAITGGGSNNNNNGGGSSGGRFSGNGPSPVLRVVVENMLYPITLDTIILIFKKYGTLAKIVTFTKNNVYQVCLFLVKSYSFRICLLQNYYLVAIRPSYIYVFLLTIRPSFNMRTVASRKRLK